MPTLPPNSDERDAALRELTAALSVTAAGQPLDISIGAAATFIVSQVEAVGDPALFAYAARTLRRVADILQPQWIATADRMPPDETPVLIVLKGKVRIGELRWDHPGHEDSYTSYRYWDDPNDDGQEWEFADITHWAPMLPPPAE